MAEVVDELRIELSADTGNAAQSINNTANALNGLGENAKNADSDVSQLVRAMSDAAARMVSVSQSIAQSVSGMSALQTGSDITGSSVNALNSHLDSLGISIRNIDFGAAAASVQSLASASESSSASLTGIVSAADGFAARMGELQSNTRGTSDGMSQLQRELSETLGTIRGFSDNISSAGNDAKETAERIRQLSEQVRQLPTSQPNMLAAGFRNLRGIVATLGIGKFIKDSNDAYVVQMQNELKLTAHMKQRMNATDAEVQSIKDLASAQQQIGVIGDEIQLAGAQQLTTYARQSSTLRTLLPAMNNLIAQNAGYEASAADATSAADMLGRALNGQYTSLTRMGVTFTEAQENVLKYGTEEQKAAVLADVINSKVGNMNELLANTPTGQLKQLQNDFGDLQEQLGATFQPLISAVIPVARSVIETLAPPIMNVSRGIATIGSVIASTDPEFVRGIALAAGGIAALNMLRRTIGGTSAGLLILGVVLTGILGSMQGQQESIGAVVADAMNGAENATNAAAGAVSDYNEELESTGKTINRLAGFDTITKLSGGSSDGALVKSLLGDSGLEELQEAVNAASDISDIQDVAPSVDFSNLDFEEMTRKVLDSIANVNWNKAFSTIGDGLKFALKIGYNGAIGILHGFKDWSDTQDWEMNFLTIGNGLGDVLGAALDVFDSIFHTHIGEWYEDLRQTAARFGRDLEQAVNPDDEGLQALEKYEKEHGSYASNDFLKLYNQGMDPEDAFNRIYNTEDLRKGFFATDYKDALNGVSEWNDLSRQDLINHLDQQYYMLDRIHEGVETVLTGTTWDKLEYIFTPMGAGTQTHNAYNDIYNYEIPSSPSSNRSDVPLRSDWISGGTPQINVSLTATIDGVEHDGRIDNYKKE